MATTTGLAAPPGSDLGVADSGLPSASASVTHPDRGTTGGRVRRRARVSPRLAELMIDHGVGVTTARTYAVKRVDSDYFENGDA